MASKGKKGAEPEPVAPPEPKTGVGSFVFPDQSRYEGGWLEDVTTLKKLRHGDGTYSTGPESYTGQWQLDAMEGQGVYLFSSGARYEGQFSKNKFEGDGRYQFADGAYYTGFWKGGQMHGSGSYTDPTGTTFQGAFYNGCYDTGEAFVALR